MALNPDARAREYREIAAKLRLVASSAIQPGVKAEMTWLAHSYDRLADKVEASESLLILDAVRSVAITEVKPKN